MLIAIMHMGPAELAVLSSVLWPRGDGCDDIGFYILFLYFLSSFSLIVI